MSDAQHDLLMLSLSKFYSHAEHINLITPIIQGKSPISLRLMDWFVTNYSKKTSTFIKTCNVYMSYRSQLKAYSKQQFDPFRRRDRITFYYNAENSIETTIGQLNFFRWVIQNEILSYITDNLKAIEQDMFSVQKKEKEKERERKREKGLSSSSSDEENENENEKEKEKEGYPSGTHKNKMVIKLTGNQEKEKEDVKKRSELSKSFVKNMNRFECSRTINFN